METTIIHALPTPIDMPFQDPMSMLTRHSRDFGGMSPSTTPPPVTADDKTFKRRSNGSINAALDETISPLDPRRFTPTLHANLVSEILSLRRDLENKTKDIDRLEQSLHQSQIKNGNLNESLVASNKEVRSVKKQMQLLEGGTLSAITDLSKERDAALEDATDLRRRLEQSQKKIKSTSENADRAQELWTKEKESWAAEKRTLETKVHIVEGRLKVVLNEVASAQTVASVSRHHRNSSQGRTSVSGSPIKRPTSGLRDRRQSEASISSDHVGGRTSALDFASGPSISLADELALEDIDEVRSVDLDDFDGRISPDALPEERGRPASSLSIKARKVLGLPFDIEDMEHGERAQSTNDVLVNRDLVLKSILKRPTYVDAGVQYAQPSAPVLERDATEPQAIVIAPVPADMVSSACQTTEIMPSPPASPRQAEAFLATIPESVWERKETKATATQTDVAAFPRRTTQYVHSRTDTHDLGIPSIAIIPPGSRPATPQSTVVLPPHTKNASCQVQSDVLARYTSSGMQTEEIRIDRRKLLSAHHASSAFTQGDSQGVASRSQKHLSSRKVAQPMSNSALKRSAPPVPPIPSHLAHDFEDNEADEHSRMTHSGNLFGIGADQIEEDDDEAQDVLFEDDDVFQRPTAKFTLRAGKMVSQDQGSMDLGELSAMSAGEALALETLRQTEEALGSDARGQVDSVTRGKNLQRTTTIRRGQSSSNKSNSSNMRKTAMISNGTAAHNHQHRHSQSTNGSSEGGGIAPPIPIPLRYSSARLGKSFSEGGRSSRGSSNTSPTRQGRRVAKPLLRKARSGPALSPAAAAGRRQRSKSPPLDARISIVPEMPLFHMPDRSRISSPINLLNSTQDAVAPRPSVATGPSRQGQHVKTGSDAPLMHQNSVVDAIAQTMVGEWMYKYVRRRKSFGKPEKEWDPSKSADELINNAGSAGIRHKRWVWVAPYERAVMWSSKQPLNGTALMGKNGRKLTIKSVLDVKDDNPMPKNSLSGPVFNRSILILTPQRALKFTATTQERHYVWLTALSFLSHSPLSVGDLTALPPAPHEEFQADIAPPTGAGSLQKRRIRDSIRLAKGSSRQTLNSQTFLPDITVEPEGHYGSGAPVEHGADPDNDAALPPVIKRYHNRNRSNTAPKAPPSAFRTFPSFKEYNSSTSASNYSQSVGTTEHGSSDRGPYTPSFGNPSMPSTRRGSEASALGRPVINNAPNFESNSSHNASMTMRMDAFIDNKPVGKGGYRNLRLASQSTKASERKKDLSYWGFDENGFSSLSPIDTISPVESALGYGESAGRANGEQDYFRSF